MSLFDSLFGPASGASFDGQVWAGFSCGFDQIAGVTLFGDGSCYEKRSPGHLELFVMSVSLGSYDPWELNSGQNPATFISNRDWILLRYILLILGLIIIPEILIVIINLL